MDKELNTSQITYSLTRNGPVRLFAHAKGGIVKRISGLGQRQQKYAVNKNHLRLGIP